MTHIAGAVSPLPASGEVARSHPLRRFWQSARGYWVSQEARFAWVLTASLVLVVFVCLAVTYGLNIWNRHFFDALEARNASVALKQVFLFPALLAVYLAMCVFAQWARMTMQRRWRAWMNDHLLRRWLSKSRFYKLELTGGDHKNPEHRINDDLRIATEMPVDFASGFLTSVLSAFTFIAVLWVVGGALNVEIGGTPLTIPGFLVIAAIIYAVIANASMLAAAFRLIPITESKNQAEAEYRYALTRVRENAESIALLGGAAAEHARLGRSFGNVVDRWRDLMVQNMRTVIVSQASGQLCGLVPILLCTPRYIDGSMSLGAMMQVASAFTIVQGAFSWFMDNYNGIAIWTASARRVAGLVTALDAAEAAERSGPGRVACRAQKGSGLQLRNLSITLSGGRPIVWRANAVIRNGEHVLLTGNSGSGKSSLVRAIAGCWPWGEGEILCGGDERVFVVPQRPYVPDGTLRAAVVYPMTAEECERNKPADVLAAAGLGHLVGQLDIEAPWTNILSEGEKQRLSIARLLLHRPDIIILDEATSALHVAGQTELMAALARELPDAAILSVGHRPELEQFHSRKLVIASKPGGARIVSDVPLPHSHPARAPVNHNGSRTIANAV